MADTLHRRAFVDQLARASLAMPLGLAAASNARAGQFTGRIKKAVKFHMIQGKLSVLDKFKLLKDLGFDGVEPRARDTLDRQALRKASEATGVAIHGCTNSSNPDIKSAIDLARYLEATSVLVVAGRVNKDVDYRQNYRQWQQIIRDALPHAEKQGIRLLVENVWNNFLLSPLEMAAFIDELQSEFAGVYFDVGNVVRIGWPEQWIRILGERVGKLDIKEYSRQKQRDEGLWKGFQVEIGDGDCDWPAVRQALVEIKYSGWATAEVPGGDRERLADVAERMDRVLDLK